MKTYYYRGISYYQIRTEAYPEEDRFCLPPSECDGLERPQVVWKRHSNWPQPIIAAWNDKLSISKN
jgi:hypothetical protein